MPTDRRLAISVVIPCLDDTEALGRCLERLAYQPADAAIDLEVVIADASQHDDCARIADEKGAVIVRCNTPGRGQQLNAGAQAARGDALVFNHADTQLNYEHLRGICVVLEHGNFVGGAFYRDFSWQYPALAWAESLTRFYTRRWGILYGDQSIFVRRETFDAIGGFAAIPIMEDVDFSSRLRKAGRIALVDPPLRTSMRRFSQRGYLRNKFQNILIIWLWRMRLVTPGQIYEWYYGRAAAS